MMMTAREPEVPAGLPSGSEGAAAFRTGPGALLLLLSRRRRWQFAGLMGLMLAGAAAEMLTLGAILPFLALLTTEQPLQHSAVVPLVQVLGLDRNALIAASALVFCSVSVMAAAIRLLVAWLTYRFSFAVGRDLGSTLFLRVLSKPYAWHVQHNSSETLAAFAKINTVVSQVLAPCMQAVVAAVVALGLLAALLYLDAAAALLAIGGLVLVYGCTWMMAKGSLGRNSTVMASSETERIRIVQEGLGGIRDVLLDRVQHLHVRRFERADRCMRAAQATNHFLGSAPRFVVESAAMIVIVGVAYFMWARTGSLALVIPTLGGIVLGAQKLMPQLQQLYQAWSSIKGNRDALEDVLVLIEESAPSPVTAVEVAGTAPVRPPANSPIVALCGVTFTYGAQAKPVLDEVNLVIRRGERVGFTGQTGSGKSTLLDILMGLQFPTKGYVQVDGAPLTAQNLAAWQKRVAHVPQSIFLADCSIAENIAFGVEKSGIDFERVRAAAKRARLSGHIEGLPRGYDTPVGERGVQLSGGQRQRIGVARALYKQADVIILDEATSALDDTTESAVMQSFNDMGQDITLLMVAHRTSTLSGCDRTYEVRDGKVINSMEFLQAYEQ